MNKLTNENTFIGQRGDTVEDYYSGQDSNYYLAFPKNMTEKECIKTQQQILSNQKVVERLKERKQVLEKERKELIEYMQTLPLASNATEEHTRLREKVVEIMWIQSILDGKE